MTRMKHLLSTLFDALAHGFAVAAPFYAAPITLRALGVGWPLPYRHPHRTEADR
jgi:hypothetical protein